MKPLILDIKGNSLDDGPGIRSVVFFKGCPLDCLWCHNPESKRPGLEISYDAKVCIGCGTCIETCPKRAISKTNPFFIDRMVCDLCLKCEETCPSGALARVGREMTADEILSHVIADKPFFDTSNGGVTLSGGEPTFYMEFCANLAKKLKENGIHVLIETCGLFEIEDFTSKVLPHVDMIYFDIKLIDPDLHKKYCGADNGVILENFAELHKRFKAGGVPVLPRTPLVPGITDTENNMRAIGKWLAMQGEQKIQVMAYHPMWMEKNAKIGIKTPQDIGPSLYKWMDHDDVLRCKRILEDEGLCVIL